MHLWTHWPVSTTRGHSPCVFPGRARWWALWKLIGLSWLPPTIAKAGRWWTPSSTGTHLKVSLMLGWLAEAALLSHCYQPVKLQCNQQCGWIMSHLISKAECLNVLSPDELHQWWSSSGAVPFCALIVFSHTEAWAQLNDSSVLVSLSTTRLKYLDDYQMVTIVQTVMVPWGCDFSFGGFGWNVSATCRMDCHEVW